MKILSRCKTWMTMAALALAVVVSGTTAEAKTITKKADTTKSVSYVGATDSISGSNIKINNKSVSKMKKKIKSIKTSSITNIKLLIV